MPNYISLKYTSEDFPDGLQSLEQKVAVFQDRVSGWQLDVALRLIEADPHSGFAVLHILTSYFEMVGKFTQGPEKEKEVTEGTRKKMVKWGSRDYFKAGIRAVFSSLDNHEEEKVVLLMKVLYEGVRCGLYHSGMTGAGVGLTGGTGTPIEFTHHGGGSLQLLINPKLLARHMKVHFETYIARLVDVKEDTLRQNFLAAFSG